MRYLMLVGACVCAFSIGSSPALALDSPVMRVDGELGYASFVNGDERRFHGMFTGLDGTFTFDDFWGLRAGYGFGLHRSTNAAFESHQLSVGLRYQFDVFHYVPWIDVSPVLHLASGEGGIGEGAHPGVIMALGFDRLLDPVWSVGAAVRYHQLFSSNRYPAYFTLGLRLGARWTFGDEFAP